MRCLIGYMAFSSATLLGLLGGAVWKSALDVFQIPCDVFTFYVALWNFAAVGVIAIFYQKVRCHTCGKPALVRKPMSATARGLGDVTHHIFVNIALRANSFLGIQERRKK